LVYLQTYLCPRALHSFPTRRSSDLAMVSKPTSTRTLSAVALDQSQFDLCMRMLSVGRPHRAAPVTGAICLAVASRIPGSLAHDRSEEHTSELQSRENLVCRLLLEKK